ncbi:homeobox-leucine zipper protein HAT14-like [Salvia splendens]|uniref:homeobox-leucine zipper protein HAT14-like n=1 Tax=Salvia splendens TaxID=180675 RepID=UPI001C259B0C|nr:homeobox-leucine zipper protein HAT14-like [Salvia splendens]
MELALSLGDTPKPFSFHEKPQKIHSKDLGFCMSTGKVSSDGGDKSDESRFSDDPIRGSSSDPPVQLDLLPFSPVQRSHPSSDKLPFPWLKDKLEGATEASRKGDDGSRDHETATAAASSPNSAVSSFQMDFSMFRSARGKRDFEQLSAINGEAEADRGGAGSDDEENGLARKKLRLTKDQSAFLEESFKEHNTLNPKQKLALAKQLNLRARQVEVWFQNRRARTKLKQTEVDCEYLKRCCETLTEENRRLQKELQELRALKASQPFYMQLPATTLTMCPSCERVVTTTATSSTAAFSLSPPHAKTAS